MRKDDVRAAHHVMKIFQAFCCLTTAHGSKVTRVIMFVCENIRMRVDAPRKNISGSLARLSLDLTVTPAPGAAYLVIILSNNIILSP